MVIGGMVQACRIWGHCAHWRVCTQPFDGVPPRAGRDEPARGMRWGAEERWIPPLRRKSFQNVAARAATGADLESGVPRARPPLVEGHARTVHATLLVRRTMGTRCRSRLGAGGREGVPYRQEHPHETADGYILNLGRRGGLFRAGHLLNSARVASRAG